MSKIFVLGATGRIGGHILELGLARGHELTAFVRSPQKLQRKHAALRVIPGDPLRADEMARVLPGHDAVLSALGPVGREALRPSTLLAECVASTVSAMKTARVERLGVVSAALLFSDTPLWFAPLRWLIRHHLHDLRAMESVVQATDFDWTIVRPPRLAQTEQERYLSARGALPPGSYIVSFRAVAAFLLDCVERNAHPRQIVGLAG